MTTERFLERLDVIVFHVFALEDSAVLLRETMDIIEEYYTPHIKEIRIRIRYNTLVGLNPTLEVLKDYDKVNIIFIGENIHDYHPDILKCFKPNYDRDLEHSLTSEETPLELLVNPEARKGMEDYDLGWFINLRGLSHITSCCRVPILSVLDTRKIEDIWNLLEDTANGTIEVDGDNLYKFAGQRDNCGLFSVDLVFNEFSLEKYLLKALSVTYTSKAMLANTTYPENSIMEDDIRYYFEAHIRDFVHMDNDGKVYASDRHGVCQLYYMMHIIDVYFRDYYKLTDVRNSL